MNDNHGLKFITSMIIRYYFSKVFAEISAFHPKIQVIFAWTRKLANEWTYRFFEWISSKESDNKKNILLNFTDNVQIENSNKSNIISVKKNIMNLENNKFTVSELKKTFENISESRLRKALQELFEENKLSKWKEKNSTIRIKN